MVVQILVQISENGFAPDAITLTSLALLTSRIGDADECRAILNEMGRQEMPLPQLVADHVQNAFGEEFLAGVTVLESDEFLQT